MVSPLKCKVLPTKHGVSDTGIARYDHQWRRVHFKLNAEIHLCKDFTVYLTMGTTDSVCSPNSILFKNNIILIR